MSTSAPEISDEKQALKDFDDQAVVRVFAASKEHARDLAGQIAGVYEAGLGKGGVQKKGHDPYPDSDLFSAKAVKHILESGERIIGLAVIKEEKKDLVVGAMVADRLSPHHVEFNSMVVPIKRRGQKIGSHIVRGLADIIDQEKFTVNCTELVTHSMASQAAHFHNGFRAICGFGFCHYPHVFFKDHPESVLWVTRLQGKLVPIMRRFRGPLGRQLGRHMLDVKQKLIACQASGQVNLASGRLDDQSLNLLSEVLKERTAYVPKRYHDLVQSILFQFEDVLDVSVKSWVRPDTPPQRPWEGEGDGEGEGERLACADDAPDDTEHSGHRKDEDHQKEDSALHKKDDNLHKGDGDRHKGEDKSKKEAATKTESLTIELKEGFAHSYIIFQQNFVFDDKELARAIKTVHKHEKRYIKVCIPANNPEALKAADYLIEHGFVFHSYLPLYGYAEQTLHGQGDDEIEVKAAEFYDILSMQWIKPSVVKDNPLPGETDSVIKLYGYPENLSGQIVGTVAQDLAKLESKS